MEISIIIRKHDIKNADGTIARSFYGATAKGRYLMQKPKIDETTGKVDDFDMASCKGLTINDQDIPFLVKITQKSAVALPNLEGVYNLSFEGSMWIDKRPDTNRPTCRLEIGKVYKFTKTHDLKEFPKAEVAAAKQ